MWQSIEYIEVAIFLEIERIIFFIREIVLMPSTDKQNQPEPTAEATSEKLQEKNGNQAGNKKPNKSNSELMAEFFAIIADEDKKS